MPSFRYTHLAVLAILLASTGLALAQTEAPRQRLSFNADWQFQKAANSDESLAGSEAIKNWRWKAGSDVSGLIADTAKNDWQNAAPNQDVFEKQYGFAWFRASLPAGVKAPYSLRFAGVDDNATVYLNGQKIHSHKGWGQSFEVPLHNLWKAGVENELAVLIENNTGAGGLGEVRLQLEPPKPPSAANTNFDDSKWRKLNLPHDWGIEGPFQQELPGETGKLPWSGTGWYRKRFTISASEKGQRFALQIDGAMSYSTVWLNGHKIGGWPYGYTSYQIDLTPFLKYGGNNSLAIRLDNVPESSRWYPGGGIYRNVWLLKTGPIHVGQWGTQVTSEVQANSGTVTIATTLQNQSKQPMPVRLISTILDTSAKPVAKSESRLTLEPGQQLNKTELKVDAPRLWSIQDPHRYTLVTQIVRGNKVLDRYITPFGIRTTKWDAKEGFSLNGKRMQLNGVCLHHDLGALGAAINVRAMERQLEIMQEMGVNAIRTSHNPPAPEFLDLCDRMGFVVFDEFTDTWKTAKKSNGYARLFDQWAEKDLRAMIRRDRNHPCVIAWSTGNEIAEQIGGAAVSRYLADIVHSEDRTRPVTTGNDRPDSGFNGFQKTLDIFGYNYKPMLYARFRETNPNIPLYGSETASTISSRGEYFFPVSNNQAEGKSDFQMSSYDLYAPGWAMSPDREFRGQDENPSVMGEFVWTGFDYLGEPTPYNFDTTTLTNFHTPEEKARAEKELQELGRIRVPSRSSYFGIVDLAGFKKDRFYIYQARWRPDLPMAHILPHWNWPERVGQVTPVHVYTSGDEAELFLNGQSQGRRKKGKFEYRLRWDDVIYQSGELHVVAYKNGQQWAEATVKTTGPAAQLTPTADRSTIKDDGKDLSFVTVTVADKDGLMVPRSKPQLKFEISGPGEIVATDNGDATDHTSFQSKERKAYNGLALVIVRSVAGKTGKITVKATSKGLRSASINLNAN